MPTSIHPSLYLPVLFPLTGKDSEIDSLAVALVVAASESENRAASDHLSNEIKEKGREFSTVKDAAGRKDARKKENGEREKQKRRIKR